MIQAKKSDSSKRPSFKARPVTLKKLVKLAVELHVVLADPNWADGALFKEVDLHVSGLLDAENVLPDRPGKGGRMTLTWRLARAEAERLFGSCNAMKGTMKGKGLGWDSSKTNALENAGYQLSAAARAFIIMAQGL